MTAFVFTDGQYNRLHLRIMFLTKWAKPQTFCIWSVCK